MIVMYTARRAHLASTLTVVLFVSMVGCSFSDVPLDTGLRGSVLRGPVIPVCQEDVPCDAPFAATFDVREGSRRVAVFPSDEDGGFEVALAPGSYLVVPQADAPIMNPTMQAQEVVVVPDHVTEVVLVFDTGIR